ncbi:killer cell lectin-like receptor subfamily B member 1B allele B [Carettochelys insculpta]|uniref:killer cell lectin-like receptor subfamily B member 1B allele B n=1 Tax=Carettochelys insculpta TaxID=44489 RepID=UPI003EB6E076
MEDREDGYTALRFKGRKKRLDGVSSTSSPFCRTLAISIGLVVTILLGTLTSLTVLIFQGSSLSCLHHAQNWSEKLTGNPQNVSHALEQSAVMMLSKLKEQFCGEVENGKAEHAQCEYCPLGWVLHQGKCYYFSEKKKNWSDSERHCSSEAANLAVLDKEEEKTFIMNSLKMEKGYYWLGLSKGKERWQWVTGAGLPAENVHVTGRNGAHTCAVCGVDEILAESCFNPNKWICEKATLEFPTVQSAPLV